MSSISGILNVAKQPGITSRRVVDRVGRLVRPARCGHAGTLDPLATGVLVVCVGQATRLIEYVQRMPKSYDGTFLLGRTSDTEDVTGALVELIDPPIPTRAEIESAAAALVGTILQRPPAYSALKVDGRRAYDLARAGQAVELAPRPVEIYGLDVVRYEYPELQLRVRCGSGTYIRSLGRDLAESLGTGAVMSALARTAIGPFTLADACDVETLMPDDLTAKLHPLARAVESLPSIQVTDAERQTLLHGKILEVANDRVARPEPKATGVAVGGTQSDTPFASLTACHPAELAALDTGGKLVALLKPVGPGLWRPTHNFT